METAAIFCCFAHVSKRLPLKKSPLSWPPLQCRTSRVRSNCHAIPAHRKRYQFGKPVSPVEMPKNMEPRHFPKFLMWKLQGIPERGIHQNQCTSKGLQDHFGHVFFDQVIEAKRVKRVPSSPTFSPGALTRLKNKMDMDDMKMPTDVGNQ